MQNVNIQELLEVGIGGKAAPDTTEQYLKRLERELHLVLLLQLAVAKRWRWGLWLNCLFRWLWWWS